MPPQAVYRASLLTGTPTDWNMHTEASVRAWETAWAATSGGCHDAYSYCFSIKREMCCCTVSTEAGCMQACPQSAPGIIPPHYCAESTLSVSYQNHVIQSEHVLINHPQLLMQCSSVEVTHYLACTKPLLLSLHAKLQTASVEAEFYALCHNRVLLLSPDLLCGSG